MTFTKERLEELAVGYSGLNLRVVTPEESMELARIALASLEAEPVSFDELRDAVAEVSGGPAMEWSDIYKGHQAVPFINFNSLARIVDKFRTAQPAPVAVPAGYRLQPISEYDAMCAAMLQGAEPVSQHPELTVWYGSMPETNGKANWTAILHRKGQHLWEGITIDRSEYPDRVRYEADRMRHLIGELADEPDILAYDADAHSGYVKPGNSPAIPAGYALVPVEPTMAILDEFDSIIDHGAEDSKDAWSRLLAASPQQEVK